MRDNFEKLKKNDNPKTMEKEFEQILANQKGLGKRLRPIINFISQRWPLWRVSLRLIFVYGLLLRLLLLLAQLGSHSYEQPLAVRAYFYGAIFSLAWLLVWSNFEDCLITFYRGCHQLLRLVRHLQIYDNLSVVQVNRAIRLAIQLTSVHPLMGLLLFVIALLLHNEGVFLVTLLTMLLSTTSTLILRPFAPEEASHESNFWIFRSEPSAWRSNDPAVIIFREILLKELALTQIWVHQPLRYHVLQPLLNRLPTTELTTILRFLLWVPGPWRLENHLYLHFNRNFQFSLDYLEAGLQFQNTHLQTNGPLGPLLFLYFTLLIWLPPWLLLGYWLYWYFYLPPIPPPDIFDLLMMTL